WVPRALGSFRGVDVLREQLCDGCNTRLGRTIMEEFARAGPEAVFREMLNVPRRAGARATNPFYFRAATDHPVQVLARPLDGEHEILWEVKSEDGEPRGQVLTQVVLRDAEGKLHPVP